MAVVLTPVERDAQAAEIKQKRCGACVWRGEPFVFFESMVWTCSVGRPGFQGPDGRRCRRFKLDEGE